MARTKKTKKYSISTKRRVVKPKFKTVELSLVGNDMAAQYSPITKEQFNLLSTNSAKGRKLWNKLDDSLLGGSGVFEECGLVPGYFQVCIDGKSHTSATAKINKETDKKIEGFTNALTSEYGEDDYFVVRKESNEAATYAVNIREKFDLKKLAVFFERIDLPDGSSLEIVSATYDGKDFEFQNSIPKGIEICAVHPKSETIV